MDEQRERLAALLEKALEGWTVFPVREGADGSQMPMTIKGLCAHLVAVLVEAGVGFVAEAERQVILWREAAKSRLSAAVEFERERAEQQRHAERAEAALAQSEATLAGLRRVHAETLARLAEQPHRIAEAIRSKHVHIHRRSDNENADCPDECGWLYYAALIADEFDGDTDG